VAARRARIEFGGVESHKEEWREARGLRLVDELRNDLTYGLRMLRASPTFTVVSVAILAIAIGANIAVFNVLDAVLFRMLPVEQPRALRELSWIERANSDCSCRTKDRSAPGRAATASRPRSRIPPTRSCVIVQPRSRICCCSRGRT
jgi:hypothetical protein